MKTPPHAVSVQNILNVYHVATANDRASGLAWYANAYSMCGELADEYGTTNDKVAGVIAALSPLTPWQRNIELARMALDMVDRIPTLQQNAAKAGRILGGESPWSVLTSQKVRAFFEGILYDGETDSVCVDRHAMSIAYGCTVGKAEQGMTPKQYAAYAAAYVTAASIIGIPAAKMQAITWVAWRRQKGIES